MRQGKPFNNYRISGAWHKPQKGVDGSEGGSMSEERIMKITAIIALILAVLGAILFASP